MHAKRWISTAVATSALASLLLAGCVVVPASQPYYVGEPVLVAPPAPRVEVIGVAPVAGYIWIGGYWSWTSGRHQWAPGYWTAPRPGHRWVPHRWEREGSRWREHGGRWERH